MTLPAAIAHIEYVASGGATFVYPFQIDLSSEIEARVNGILNTATVHYTVSGVGSPTGGTVTFFIPPANGAVVSLRRIVNIEQLLDLVPNSPLPAAALEDRLDEIVKMVQMLEEEDSRRPQVGVGSKSTLRYLVIPSPHPLTLWGWNASGDGISLFDPAIVQVIPATVGDPTTIASGWLQSTTTVTVNAIAGQAIIPIPNLYPSGAYVRSVTIHITTGFGAANGLSTLSIGDSVLSDRWGSGVPITTNTVTNASHFRTTPFGQFANGNAHLLADMGTFDATGTAVVRCHFEMFLPDLPSGAGALPTGGWVNGKNTVSISTTAFVGQGVIPIPLLYPAAAYIRAVTMRITSGFGLTNGLTGLALGDLTLNDRWGSDIATNVGIVTNASYFHNPEVGFSHVAGTDGFLFAESGAFDATGAAVVTCHFEVFVPDS